MKACFTSLLTLVLLLAWNASAQAILVGHYKLNESGTTTSTPNSAVAAPGGTNGTVTDASGPFDFDSDSGWRPGVSGNAFEFDGTDDLIDVGNNGYDGLGQGTITAWINVDDFNRKGIFTSASDSNVNSWLRFGVRNDLSKNRISIGGQYTTSNELMSDTTNLLPNTWYHVAATSDGSTWRLYVNGMEESAIVLAGANNGQWFNYINSVTHSNSFAIGALRRSSGDVDFFNGLIDDVQLYTTPLSGNELSLLAKYRGLNLEEALFQASIPEPGTGLLLAVAGCCMQIRRRSGRGNN